MLNLKTILETFSKHARDIVSSQYKSFRKYVLNDKKVDFVIEIIDFHLSKVTSSSCDHSIFLIVVILLSRENEREEEVGS